MVLSYAQQQIIVQGLADGLSYDAIAEKASCSWKTVSRYDKRPKVRKKVQQSRANRVRMALGRGVGKLDKCLEIIHVAMEKDAPTVEDTRKVSSARTAFELTQGMRKDDQDERLTILEEKMAAREAADDRRAMGETHPEFPAIG